jgi:hypothetical protein
MKKALLPLLFIGLMALLLPGLARADARHFGDDQKKIVPLDQGARASKNHHPHEGNNDLKPARPEKHPPRPRPEPGPKPRPGKRIEGPSHADHQPVVIHQVEREVVYVPSVPVFYETQPVPAPEPAASLNFGLSDGEGSSVNFGLGGGGFGLGINVSNSQN